MSIPDSAGPTGLLLCRDLFFTSKVTGTARALGYRVLTVGGAAQVLAQIEQVRPRAVFVDLAAGDLVAPEALRAYIQAAGPGTTFLAFGAHVDAEALAAARAAGCDPVLPRSKFTAELPELIRRAFGDPPAWRGDEEGSSADDADKRR